MRKLIHVTRQDIEEGIPESCGTCPVALALARELGTRHPRVYVERCNLGGPTDKSIDLPRSAVRFIRRFDERKPVKPFNFFLEVAA